MSSITNQNAGLPGPFRPSTAPGGIGAGDYETHDSPAPAPVRQFKGGATAYGDGAVHQNVHATSRDGPVHLPPAPDGARVVFRSEHGGSVIPSRQAKTTDIVDLPVVGTTSVAAALASGFLVENEHGVLEYAGGTTKGGRDDSPDAGRDGDHQDRSDEPQVARKRPEEMSAAELEAAYRSMERQVAAKEVREAVGEGTAAQIEAAIAETGDVSEQQLDDLAAEHFSGDRDAARQAIATAAAPLVEAAREVAESIAGPGAFEELGEWCDRDPAMKAMRGDAIRDLTERGSTEGMRALTKEFLVRLHDTDPDRLVAALAAGRNKVKKLADGTVLLELPRYGWTSFKAALKGIIK
jgi:hypothetical protein